MAFLTISRWAKFAWWRLAGRFPEWRRLGRFSGDVVLRYHSPTNFDFLCNPNKPFSFERGSDPDDFKPTGEIIQPMDMQTDGGTIPRVAELVGLNRLTYMHGYLIHDWEFEQHHAGLTEKSLEQVNVTLCEAAYTMMRTGQASVNDFHLRLIYDGVSSPLGQDVWDGKLGVDKL